MRTTKSTKITKFCTGVFGFLCVLGALRGSASAQFEMPDPKQMAGIPRPVDDLPAGSVSVRLIRGQLSNNIASHPVELHFGNGRVLTVNTDEAGRAQFDKLPAGQPLKAIAVVDGERLESQEFPAPAQGGIRLMLVATDKSAPARATTPGAPAVSGEVVLGGDSRIVVEPGDDNVALYLILEVVNNSQAPVNPTPPFAFDMPKGAQNTTLLDGSSPLARTRGGHISLAGPLPPGRTLIQIVCELPVSTGSLDISQTFPARLERLTLLVKKVGDTTLASSQVERQQDFAAEGQTIIGSMGGAVAAGQPIVFSLTNLPHHSPLPRWTALGLAGAIVLIGVWVGTRKNDPATDVERKRLVARREKLLADLVRLEHDHRSGRSDGPRYATRREELVGSLERLYGALDDPDRPAGATA